MLETNKGRSFWDRPLSQLSYNLDADTPPTEPVVNDNVRGRRAQRRRLDYFFAALRRAFFLAGFRFAAFFLAGFRFAAFFLAGFRFAAFLAAFFLAGFRLAAFFLAAFFLAGFFLATFFLAVFLAAAFRVFLRAAGFLAAGFFRAAGFFLAAGFRLADFLLAARAATFAIRTLQYGPYKDKFSSHETNKTTCKSRGEYIISIQ